MQALQAPLTLLKPLCLSLCLVLTHALADLREYKIALWNLNDTQIPIEEKWNNTILSLLSGKQGVDVLALQEVASLPAGADFLQTFTPSYATTIPIYEYQWNLGGGYGRVFVYFMRSDTESRGIHLALVSKKRASAIYAIKPSTKDRLPMLAIALGDDIFVTMNTFDKKTNVVANISDIYEFFSNLQQDSLQWILLGSFHLSPQNLQARLSPSLQEHIAIIAPAVATRKSGGTLDYAISGNADEQPYQAPTLKSYLGYGVVRLQFSSPFIPVIFSK